MVDFDGPDVALTLSPAEALVLFDLLARFDRDGRLAIDDAAEQGVLFHVLAQLERRLTEPLRADYARLLEAARASVRAALG